MTATIAYTVASTSTSYTT